QTYVVLNNYSESNEIDPLIELANQNKSIKKRKSKFQREEILVEWKQKKIKEGDSIFCAEFIYINFFISQKRM
ncbi:15967_t:CDS:1, partial [Cetraspora pellucida]